MPEKIVLQIQQSQLLLSFQYGTDHQVPSVQVESLRVLHPLLRQSEDYGYTRCGWGLREDDVLTHCRIEQLVMCGLALGSGEQVSTATGGTSISSTGDMPISTTPHMTGLI